MLGRPGALKLLVRKNCASKEKRASELWKRTMVVEKNRNWTEMCDISHRPHFSTLLFFFTLNSTKARFRETFYHVQWCEWALDEFAMTLYIFCQRLWMDFFSCLRRLAIASLNRAAIISPASRFLSRLVCFVYDNLERSESWFAIEEQTCPGHWRS